MSANNNQESEVIVIEGVVDSISPMPDQELGVHLARVLMCDSEGKQRNVQVSAVNVKTTRIDESKTEEETSDKPPLRVKLEGKPSIFGGLSVETALFLIPNDVYADWFRKTFGFHRPGESFEALDVPENFMYGRC